MAKALSHSAREVFLQCQRKFMFLRELRWEPIAEESQGRRMGRAFGEALEAWFGEPWAIELGPVVDESYGITREWVESADAEGFEHVTVESMPGKQLGDEELDEWVLEAGKVRVLAEAYVAKYGDEDQGVAMEVEFDHPVLGRGFLDGVKVDDDGLRVGIETKLLHPRFWNRSSEQQLRINQQVTAYFAAMREAGTPLDRLEFRPTFKPGIDRRMKRDPETIDQYLERLEGVVAADPDKFLGRYVLYRTDEQMDEFLEEARDVFKQVGAARRRGVWPKSTDRCGDYGGCPLMDVCSKVPGAEDAFRVRPEPLVARQQAVVDALFQSNGELTGEGTPVADVARQTPLDREQTYPVLRQLVRRGLVERVGRGLYVLTDEGRGRAEG